MFYHRNNMIACLPCYLPVKHFSGLLGKDISVLIGNYKCELCVAFEIRIINGLLILKIC